MNGKTVKEDLQKVIDELMFKYDAVQIFVTSYDGKTGYTKDMAMGYGNWFARRGMIQEWLERNDEHVRCDARGGE